MSRKEQPTKAVRVLERIRGVESKKDALAMRCMLFCLFPILSGILQAQTTPAVTLTSTARLVVVDVVVTGRDGKPVHGLQASNFRVLDDKHPQMLGTVEEHVTNQVAASPSSPAPPPLPPGTFTNQIFLSPSAPLNAILIDNLNTPLSAQAYLRTQLLKYLDSLTPSARIAVFTLNSRLAMVQGFTSDPRVLRQAIMSGAPLRSVLLTDEQQHDTSRPTMQQRSEELGFGPHPSGSVLDAIARQLNFENQEESQLAANRATITLDALDLLGRYLAGFTGRKNLIWFSGSFPVNLAPRSRVADTELLSSSPILAHDIQPFSASFSLEGQFRKVSDVLANHQVAVYPVDSRGLLTSPDYNATTGSYSYNPEAVSEFTSDLAEEHSTMLRIAADTGGQALFNNNDFSRAIGRAIQDGSDYYTLTYTPRAFAQNGSFHKLHVDLLERESGPETAHASLSYRDGYFADPATPSAILPSETASGSKHRVMPGRVDQLSFDRAMGHGLPEPAQIVFQVHVQPSSPQLESVPAPGNKIDQPGFGKMAFPSKWYSIRYHLDAQHLVFTSAGDSLQTLLQFTSIVYNAESKPVVSESGTATIVIATSERASLLRNGLDFQQQISIPVTGEYSLRTGVYDLNSSQVGALEIPVALLRKLPPLSNADNPPALEPVLKHRP